VLAGRGALNSVLPWGWASGSTLFPPAWNEGLPAVAVVFDRFLIFFAQVGDRAPRPGQELSAR